MVRTAELQAARKRVGATQADAAEAIGCSPSTYSEKENNIAKFDVVEVVALCNFLKIYDDAEKAYIFLC